MMLSEPQTSSGQMARQLSTSSTGSCQFQVGRSTGHEGVTKRCRLSWLTNSVLVYELKCVGGVVAGSQPMSTAVQEPKLTLEI